MVTAYEMANGYASSGMVNNFHFTRRHTRHIETAQKGTQKGHRSALLPFQKEEKRKNELREGTHGNVYACLDRYTYGEEDRMRRWNINIHA